MRLLLVEDYRPLRQSLAKGLREADFAVDATGDGQEGLWYALGNEYDVIVLDLMLPGLDGLEILKKIRSQGRESCVLILTAKDTVQDRVTGLDLGADDYLVKPFAFEELLARIRALLRRRYQERNPCVEVADLRIDLTTQRVWRQGEEIPLTPREYGLLEYLALHAGRTVRRSDIWEHI
jgi:DNA-binding response OmpR family regulator